MVGLVVGLAVAGAGPGAHPGSAEPPQPSPQPAGDPARASGSDAWAAWVERHAHTIAIRTALPRSHAACRALVAPGLTCADVDRDGLTDAWEDAVLGALVPSVELAAAEPGLDEPGVGLAAVGRVVGVDGDRTRVFIMLGYPRDHGRCGWTAHRGDSERVALELVRPAVPRGAGDLILDGAYTAAHEGEILDRGRLVQGEELQQLAFPPDPGTGRPRWRVYASARKHATYGSVAWCEAALRLPCLEEDCGAPGGGPGPLVVVPRVINAGEPDAPRVTELSAIGFPGEQAWVDQPFCGGLGRARRCASAVVDKLTVDPFAGP